MLESRQVLIEQTIATALENLCNLDETEKTMLYSRLLQSTDAHEGQITVNAKDQPVMQALLPQLDGKFELLTEPGSFSGGFTMRRGRIEDNLTFDLMVRNLRPQLVALAGRILFPDAD